VTFTKVKKNCLIIYHKAQYKLKKMILSPWGWEGRITLDNTLHGSTYPYSHTHPQKKFRKGGGAGYYRKFLPTNASYM